MNINDVKKVIKAAAAADDTVLISSKHGIGKSSIVKQFAKENNYSIVELFLSHQEVGDIIGMPRTIHLGTEVLTTWTRPTWLQRMIDSAWPVKTPYNTIEFKDEQTKASFESLLPHTFKPTDTITRDLINQVYCAMIGLDSDHLHLPYGQTDITCTASKNNVLFLDELNRAPIDVRQSALQLVLDKQIHEHKLPSVAGKPTMIVAAINPSDDYQVDELDPALLDRFLTVDAEVDVPAWLAWSASTGINEIVRSFITENPTRLHYTPKQGKGATPRAWAKLASFMDTIDSIPQEVIYPILCGKIGSELGSQFLSFYNNYSKVIKMEDIEDLVSKKHKTTSKIEATAKHVAKLIENQEAIQKQELANQFIIKYINEPATNAIPMLAYLYALELEIINSILKSFKESNITDYMKLAVIDGEINDKKLFLRIVNSANAA